MRIALISDIHGNLVALHAVLDALEAESIDQVVCLGDVAIFGPQPRETLNHLRRLACPIVMGNTDAWALRPTVHPLRNENSVRFNDIEFWGAMQLTREDRAFIRTFPTTITLALGDGATLLCYHGSPYSFDEGISAATPSATLETMFAGFQARVMAGGHTHAPMVRRHQGRLVVNPGSVGLPYTIGSDGRSRNPPWAEYMVLIWQNGQMQAELRRALIDLNQLARSVNQVGMPHAAWWLKDWGR
jgi:putative phosphoesterase